MIWEVYKSHGRYYSKKVTHVPNYEHFAPLIFRMDQHSD